uniref:ANK_REP_REGION domain-containing protein n=1 Tax=Macrostomum lignano TaxID=282301 RepID=A0A1I8HHF1_9PLAT
MNVDIRGVNNETALCLAAAGGHTDLLNLFLQHKADVNAQDEDGDTPLITAVINGKNAFVRALLDQCGDKLNLDLRNKAGKTAIQIAFKAGNEEVVTLLADKNARFDCDDEKQKKILFKCAVEGKAFFIKFWFRQHPGKQAVINMTRNSHTLSSVSALNGSLDVLEVLHQEGANLDIPDKDGDTPLFCAAQNGFRKIVEFLLLLEHDRSLGKERNADGSTPALLAAMKGKHEVLQVLAENDCLEANDVDNDGSTILMMAIQSGSVPTVRMLLETGDCNTTAVNNNGIGVQTLATQCRDEAMLELLRQFGIEGQLAEAEATEAQQTSTGLDCGVGKPKRHKARFAVDRILKDTTTNDQLTDEE